MSSPDNTVWRIIINQDYLKDKTINPRKILVDNGYNVINKHKDYILIEGSEDYARNILETYVWIYVMVEATLPQDIPTINDNCKHCCTFRTYHGLILI